MDELGMDGEVTALKRKLDFNTSDGKKKRKAGLVDIEEEIEDDVESDSSEGSPIHVELCDSSSDDGTCNDKFYVRNELSSSLIILTTYNYCNLYGLKVGDEFGDEWELEDLVVVEHVMLELVVMDQGMVSEFSILIEL
jgi:hypothetical protein